MKNLGMDLVPISQIDVVDRLRGVDEGWVEGLMETIRTRGFVSAIQVAKSTKGRFRLVDGAHRLEACSRLDMESIPAFIIQANEKEIRLHEVFAQLQHRDLRALDRARFIAAGKTVYEELYPETRKGAHGGRGGKTNETEIFSFSKATAEKLGLHERTVQRSIRIATGISPEMFDWIDQSPIADREGELYELSGFAADEQPQIVDLLFRSENPARSVKAAAKIIAGHTKAEVNEADANFRKLMDAWNRASPKTRKRFLTEIGASM